MKTTAHTRGFSRAITQHGVNITNVHASPIEEAIEAIAMDCGVLLCRKDGETLVDYAERVASEVGKRITKIQVRAADLWSLDLSNKEAGHD